MRPKKLACWGEGPSTFGQLEPTLASVTGELVVVGTMDNGGEGSGWDRDTSRRGYEEASEASTIEKAVEDPLLAEGETPDTAPVLDTSGSESSGSESFVPSTEGSEETESEEVTPEVGPSAPTPPATGMVEDDAWYRNILDFIHQVVEGDTGAPLDFVRAHIPHDKVQVSGPHKDASRAEFATATLAARGQVTIFPLSFNYLPVVNLV